MGFILQIEKTSSTPYIFIDEDNGYMQFQGESFHENVISFYQDVSNWIEHYLDTDFTKFTFDCELKYFNSSTAKFLLNILIELDEYAVAGKEIVVNWITTADNAIIIECYEDFEEEIEDLAFNLIIR